MKVHQMEENKTHKEQMDPVWEFSVGIIMRKLTTFSYIKVFTDTEKILLQNLSYKLLQNIILCSFEF